MQRLRLAFGRGQGLKYVAHLDMMRLWERVFRRAAVILAYSEGFNPHPKISLALPLPVGTTSAGELMDVILAEPVDIPDFVMSVGAQLPPDLYLISVQEIDAGETSVAAAVQFAEYEVGFGSALSADSFDAPVSRILAAESLPRERVREGKARKYDLRPLVDALRVVEGPQGQISLWMRLKAGSNAAGRPEEVVAALEVDIPHRSIHRLKLVLENKS